MRAIHAPIARLVEELSNPNHGAGRRVVDETGLAGFYDFEIDWLPSDVTAAEGDGRAPSVFSALAKLGLKLEPGMSRVPVILIEHAEMPGAN